MKNEKTVVDIDYAEAIVPKSARRGIVTMFMIMLGFTFSPRACGWDSSWRTAWIFRASSCR